MGRRCAGGMHACGRSMQGGPGPGRPSRPAPRLRWGWPCCASHATPGMPLHAVIKMQHDVCGGESPPPLGELPPPPPAFPESVQACRTPSSPVLPPLPARCWLCRSLRAPPFWELARAASWQLARALPAVWPPAWLQTPAPSSQAAAGRVGAHQTTLQRAQASGPPRSTVAAACAPAVAQSTPGVGKPLPPPPPRRTLASTGSLMPAGLWSPAAPFAAASLCAAGLSAAAAGLLVLGWRSRSGGVGASFFTDGLAAGAAAACRVPGQGQR